MPIVVIDITKKAIFTQTLLSKTASDFLGVINFFIRSCAAIRRVIAAPGHPLFS